MSFRTISVCFSIVWAVIVTSTAASVIDHNLFPDLYEQFLDNRSEYRVVLLRHGETDDNAANHYSGWYDTQLTVKGIEQTKIAGQILNKWNLTFDTAFISELSRTHETLANMIPYIDGGQNIVIHKSWRMNERHYGALTGLSKDTVQFTPTFTGRPPPMESTHPRWQSIAAHPAYAELIANDTMPRTESLKDTYDRMFPYWVSTIIPEMQTKKRIIVVSHENALRSLMKYIDKIDGIEAATLKLRQCGLYIYEFDKNMNVVVSRHYVD